MIPFLCVFLAFLLNYASKIPLSVAMARQGRGYDNRNPREQQAKLEGWGRRAHAAHLNGFEMFPAFAAAVILAHLTSADPGTVKWLAITFVVSRIVYICCYIADWHLARSTVWGVGFACVSWLFVLSLH